MSTRALVDPQVLPLLGVCPPLDLTAESLPAIRAASTPPPAETPPDVEATERLVPGPEGAPEVRILIYRPKHQKGLSGALLQIHGGGYVLGTAEKNAARNASIAIDVGCVVVAVDYRLAPETPFPGPVEDCYAALRWLRDNAADLGVDPALIAIGGESAGGGLGACLALMARDRKEIAVAFQLLVYPMLDDRTVVHTDPHPHTGEFIWTATNNRFGWASLLGQEPGSKDVSPYAAAARATDLTGLPPAFIAVGALDLFLEEDMEYARRLIRARVPTELHVVPGGFHAFDLVAEAGISKRFERDSRDALRRAFYPAG